MAGSPEGPPPPPDKEVAYVYAAALGLGFYLASLIFTFRWLIFSDEGWKKRKNISWPMVFVTALIFTLTMSHSSLDLKGVMDQILFMATHPGEKYVAPLWINICKCMFANSIALSADWILVYRCYVVYGRRLPIIVFPSFFWIVGLVSTAIQLYLQVAHIHDPNIGPYEWANVNMTVGPGIALIPFWGSTTVLNIYCTTVLTKRIYQVSKSSETSATTKQFRFIARITAESGFIFTSISLAHFVVWFTKNNFAVQIISVINVPLIGIAFNLILIRAAYGRTEYLEEKPAGIFSSIMFGANAESITIGHHGTEQKGLSFHTQSTLST